MQDSKKAVVTTGIVFLLCVLLSVSFLAYSSPKTHNYDWYLREDMAGTIDFLILGASQGQDALYTREIDRIIGSNSYNLCYNAERNYEKEYLLNKELARNSINTVVFELSYDAMELSSTRSKHTDANIFTAMRMDSFSDRMDYFFRCVSLSNKLYVYADLMFSGLTNLFVENEHYDSVQEQLKGSCYNAEVDHSLNPEEVTRLYNSKNFSISAYKEDTINDFTKMIEKCQKENIRVIVVAVPVSDNYVWCHDNLDDFLKWATQFCEENGVEFYDFNLFKEKNSLLSDVDCYNVDGHHMSEIGAKVFSEAFAKVILEAANGIDVSQQFYRTYWETKMNSPYAVYYDNE